MSVHAKGGIAQTRSSAEELQGVEQTEQDTAQQEVGERDLLQKLMAEHGITLWGVADLNGFSTPVDESGKKYPRAVSFAVAMIPEVMAAIEHGPTHEYAGEYIRVNKLINEYSVELAEYLRGRGARALPLAASVRTDAVNYSGDFPQKTAATRAGLGWIGRNCQLVTKSYGPWVRLGSVFTDLPLVCSTPTTRNYCGTCNRCVEACPAHALQGASWVPGLAREKMLDAVACDNWKTAHYMEFNKGRNCGICAAVCPYGLKQM